MPVTIKPSNRSPDAWGKNPYYIYTQASSPEQLLQCTISDDTGSFRQNGSPPSSSSSRRQRLVQSSFKDLSRESNLYATKNGLVHACIEAYNNHHNLVLRPEHVWFAILAQLGAHVQAHASRLRHLFIAQEQQGDGENGQLHIEVPLSGAVDHGALAFKMAKLLGGRMRDPALADWVMPAFTTTEKIDQAVAAVLFMGAMQRYFTYSWGTRCGIPSVTLLGEVEDWILIRDRCADRLGTGAFGKTAADWWVVLKPVLDGFVESFADPEGEAALRFWRRICCEHLPNGSGTTTYSGWITAFCYWDEQGRCLHKGSNMDEGGSVRLSRSDVPMGFSKVPVTLLDNGAAIETEMIAGSVGIKVRNLEDERESDGEGPTSVKPRRSRRQGYDTIQPEIGWFMYRL